jgi:hypothetical protein
MPPRPPAFPPAPRCAYAHPHPPAHPRLFPRPPAARPTHTHVQPSPVVHTHTATAVPRPLPAPEAVAQPAAPEAAFVYVAITIPALVAAGSGAFHQFFGRGR